jgi:hypothetical protein
MGSCWQVLTSIWDDLEWEYVKCSSFFILNPWTVGIQIDSYFLGLLCVTSVFPIQPWIVYIQVSFSLLCTVSSSKVDFFDLGWTHQRSKQPSNGYPMWLSLYFGRVEWQRFIHRTIYLNICYFLRILPEKNMWVTCPNGFWPVFGESSFKEQFQLLGWVVWSADQLCWGKSMVETEGELTFGHEDGTTLAL